jgi:hypothetical protein
MKKTKRSKCIRLLLLGGLSAGALASCTPARQPAISTENVYANDFYVPGAGYYHAPFYAWYRQPYNYYDPQKRLYLLRRPMGRRRRTKASSMFPRPRRKQPVAVEAIRTDIPRGGFGCYGGHYSTYA